ncbi:hypothetical protein NIES2104_26260 [Leptolyngbya sp. NIES-2104]|nr:hypothetical protein NIES2104_26260 [Leptolyngbya sp. NIES-2104]
MYRSPVFPDVGKKVDRSCHPWKRYLVERSSLSGEKAVIR